MQISEQTLNLRALMERCLDSAEFAASIVQQFLETWDSEFARLSDHLASRNLAELAGHAHRLKGTAATIGAERLSTIMADIEKLAKTGEADRIPQPLLAASEEARQIRQIAGEQF